MNRLWRSMRRSFLSGSLAPLGVLALASSVDAQVGTVQSEQKISETAGGFGGVLDLDDLFGHSVASLGDLDGDGNEDLAVGAIGDDDGGVGNQGAVWILFMNSDGTVASEQKISAIEFSFGESVAALGDLDGDGNEDLAVGAYGDDQGSVWILFLNSDGTVASQQRISETSGGFGGVLDLADNFGWSVVALGDLDGDGNEDLAVGTYFDDDGGLDQGAVWILFLNADGTVASEQKISETTGNFGGVLDNSDIFGTSVAALGDLDGDGNEDLAVGAPFDDDGGSGQGAVWILFLNADGTVASEQKISATSGGFGGDLDLNDGFGYSVAALGDLDGAGNEDLAVGAFFDDDGNSNRGAVWILFLNADGTVASEQKISDTAGGFGGVLHNGDLFGWSVAALGDLDGDGNEDLAVGAAQDDDGGSAQGAVWILFLEGPLQRKARRPQPVVTLPTPTIVPSTASGGGPLASPALELEGTRGRPGEPRVHGAVSLRNGSGVNEFSLSSASVPLAGEEWQVWVDVSAHPQARASIVLASKRAVQGTPSVFGELLIDVRSRQALFTSLVVSHGAADVHALSLPAELLGRSLSLQALVLDGRGSALTNALDLVVGRRP